MPVFDVLERTAIKRFSVAPGLTLRFIVRSVYVGTNIIAFFFYPFKFYL